MIRVHGTCVAVEGVGVLLRGPSGGGKSDLGLRLIDGGARLVADDQVELDVADGRLIARAPATIAGLIEVRGLGLFRLPCVAAPLGLAFDLTPGPVERLPEAARAEFLGIGVPRFALDPWTVSAAAKVRLAAEAARGTIIELR